MHWECLLVSHPGADACVDVKTNDDAPSTAVNRSLRICCESAQVVIVGLRRCFDNSPSVLQTVVPLSLALS